MSDEHSADGPESPENGGATGSPEPSEHEAQEESLPKSGAISLSEVLEHPEEVGAIEAYQQRARLAEDRLAEVLGAYRKFKAENEGYRERIAKNAERRFDQRRERLLLKFIEILDNLDRALEAAETTYAGEALVDGLILVRTQLLQTLKDEGLERIPVLGLPYDPACAEAVETREVSEPEHHHLVVKELLRGYRLNGRLARPSRVVVGEYSGPMEDLLPEGTSQTSSTAENLAESGAGSAVEALLEEADPGGETLPLESPSDEMTSVEPATPVTPALADDSLEDIVSRTEAQEALFPDAFEDEEQEKKG